MKAIKYTVLISGGWLEYSHGMQYPIQEIFIPELGVCVNIGDGNLNIISDQIKPRTPVKNTEKEIKLPALMSNLIMQELENKRFHQEIMDKIKYIFEESLRKYSPAT